MPTPYISRSRLYTISSIASCFLALACSAATNDTNDLEDHEALPTEAEETSQGVKASEQEPHPAVALLGAYEEIVDEVEQREAEGTLTPELAIAWSGIAAVRLQSDIDELIRDINSGEVVRILENNGETFDAYFSSFYPALEFIGAGDNLETQVNLIADFHEALQGANNDRAAIPSWICHIVPSACRKCDPVSAHAKKLLNLPDWELYELASTTKIGQYCHVKTGGYSAACRKYVKGRADTSTGYDGSPLTTTGLGTGCIKDRASNHCYFSNSRYPLTSSERASMCTSNVVTNGAAQLRYAIRNGDCMKTACTPLAN